MNKLAVTAAWLLISLCASFANARTAAPPSDLATADWSVKQAKILNAEPNEAVWKFMSSDGSNDVGLGELCEFHFADLHHSGELSLVISYDYGGTMGCNYVAIFEKTRAGIEKYDFDSGSNFSFDSIEDINGRGHYELVVDFIFGEAQDTSDGSDCHAQWPVVYAWNGSGYSDVSAESKGYYRKTLADLMRQINAAAPTPDPEQAKRPPLAMEIQTYENQSAGPSPQGGDGQFFPGRSVPDPSRSSHGNVFVEVPEASPSPTPDTSGSDDCSKAFAAKIQRILGSPEAGIDDAVKYLRRLSTDKEWNIANSAKDVLKSGGPGGVAVQPTIHGEMFYPETTPPRAK